MEAQNFTMNRLKNEKSPYLLHHADNPVDWYPWAEEAFERARKENKPVILSIGYSTCHWCHVMAHESFENKQIAALMNDHFISVKVDREERPDLDQVYMASVTAMTGQGGWPLTVFLTPEKKPFYGGTYFPPFARWGAPGFADLLKAIHQSWSTKPDEVIASSVELTELLKRRFSTVPDGKTLSDIQLDQMFNRLSSQFDSVYGGFSQAPKFPMGHTLSLLLRYWKRSGNKDALEMVEQTLTFMARGGIYDQLGGGFHRYSTDQLWHVPHFEKMLYDQALLVRPYLEVFQITNEKFFADIARDVLAYVLRDMTDANGGFFSAEDADSFDPELGHDKEGSFYVWSLAEIKSALPPENAEIAAFYWGLKEAGNAESDPHGEFTGKNILSVIRSIEETAGRFKINLDETGRIIQEAKNKLLEARSRRKRPHLDDKILTDWNGLMISAFAFASQVLDDNRYTHAARRAADFILEKLIDRNGRLLHRYRDGESGIPGTLEDYAFFSLGLLDLYEATFDIKYFKQARVLTDAMVDLFWDADTGGFFLTGNDAETLIVRSKEVYDGALPSGNSAAAFVLSRLYHMTGAGIYNDRFGEMMSAFAGMVSLHPEAYSFFLSAFDFHLGPVDEIVLSGPQSHPEYKEMKRTIFETFRPRKVVAANYFENKRISEVAGTMPLLEGRTFEDKNALAAYVCRDHLCLRPVSTGQELSGLLNENPIRRRGEQ